MADEDINISTSDDPRVADDSNKVPSTAIVPEEEHTARMKQIRERFQTLLTAWTFNFDEGHSDDNFVAGDQWEDIARRDREDDGRPVHTYNLMLTFCNMITHQIRQNWPQIRVRPVDNDSGRNSQVSNVQGTKDYSMADVLMGIIRNIEHISKADQAYDTAVEHSVHHGFGSFRVIPRYTRNDSFDQELVIKRIKNSYSVLIDSNCEEADFSDMQDAFVFSTMRKKAFERLYPDEPTSSFDNAEHGLSYEGWYEKESVRIAEYYWIDYVQDEVVQLSNGMVVYRKDVEKVLDELEEEEGIHELRSRKVKKPVCMWQKMTADSILEGPIELPFTGVPICMVVGKELIVRGEVQYHSAIRHAKDAQRAFNYWQTAATETVALRPKAPYLVTADQIEGYEQQWEEANRRNLPFLEYNYMEGQPTPQRMPVPEQANAELQQAGIQQQVMRDIVGLHEASFGAGEVDRSGKAINALNARGDIATFVYPDNLARAVQYMGRLLVEAIPKIYDTERVMRIRMPDDSEDFVEINKAVKDEQSGDIVYINDLSYGRYDVVIDTGPSYATQRQEAQDMILETLGKLPPEMAAQVSHLLVKNMDFPGAEDVYELLRRMLPDELKSESERLADLPKGYIFDEETGQPVHEETGEPLPPPPPTPEQEIAQMEQQANIEKHKATQADAAAKEKQAEAKIVEAQAKIAEAQAGGADQSGAMQEALEKQSAENMQMVQQVVEEVAGRIMQEHRDDEKAHQTVTQEWIAEAIADALRRVKQFTTRQVQANQQERPAPNGTGQQTPAPSNAAPAGTVKLEIGEGQDLPREIIHEYDDDGNLVKSVPVFDETEEDD